MQTELPSTNGGPPGMSDAAVRLSIPPHGLADGDLLFRLPTADDVDGMTVSFEDPEIRDPANLPSFGRDELVATLPYLPALVESGRLMPLAVVELSTGELVGGGQLHHLDAERAIVELGYWVLPHARRRGIATRIARVLAEHAFALGVKRVAAYVNVGNVASENVLRRAGFTREGVVRSLLPRPDGSRADKTLFSLLPGD
jgi:RimJ/RimL family protein N-acetyltransferase